MIGIHVTHPWYSVLITDDDPEVRETLREIVEPAGLRAVLAADGEEAIAIAQTENVHLALMDMHMPRLTGLETLAILRTMYASLPSILITAQQSDDLLRQALSQQVFCVLAKPVSRHLVLYQVTRALHKFYQPA